MYVYNYICICNEWVKWFDQAANIRMKMKICNDKNQINENEWLWMWIEIVSAIYTHKMIRFSKANAILFKSYHTHTIYLFVFSLIKMKKNRRFLIKQATNLEKIVYFFFIPQSNDEYNEV